MAGCKRKKFAEYIKLLERYERAKGPVKNWQKTSVKVDATNKLCVPEESFAVFLSDAPFPR